MKFTGTSSACMNMFLALQGCRVSSLIQRSDEHPSELQSQSNLVCRLLLEKKQHTSIRPCSERALHVPLARTSYTPDCALPPSHSSPQLVLQPRIAPRADPPP